MILAEARRLLNVSPDDSPELIKKKWRQASLDNHPDRNSGDSSESEATRRQQNINLAYDILRGRTEEDPPPASYSGNRSSSNASSNPQAEFSTKRLGLGLLCYGVVFGLEVITLGFSTATFITGLIVFGVIGWYI